MTLLPNAKSFILTLPRSKDRLDATLAHFQAEDLDLPTPVYGLDGRVTGLWTHHTYRIDNPDQHYRMGEKAIALFLSHYLIWSACAYGNYDADAFIIFEDDARLVHGWKSRWESALEKVPSDWDILFPGSCCTEGHTVNKPLGNGVYTAQRVQCTHCYIVRAKAIPTLFQSCQKFWTHLDLAIMFDALPKLKGYIILPRIVTQLDTIIPP